MRTSSYFILACWAVCALYAAPARAALFVTTGTYDATSNANAVDTDATGTLATFTTQVANAFNSNLGGVAAFDEGADRAADATYSFSYGAGQAKTLTLTSSVALDHVYVQASGTVTPISGVVIDATGSGGVLTRSGGVSADTTLTFSSITGGLPGEYLESIAFTILSRNTYTASGRVFNVTANYSDATNSGVISSNVSNVKAGDDTFWSFTAPAGASITSILIDAATNGTTTAEQPVFDDIAFITAVPEPSTALLVMSGAGLLTFRRRRRRRG